MSGITASGSNIRRLGKRFTYVIGEVTPGILEGIARAARVAAVVGALRQARFGIIGTPCPGMLDVEAEDSDFEKVLGSTTVRFDLDALVAAADAASRPKPRAPPTA